MDSATFLSECHENLKALTTDGELGLAGYMWSCNDKDEITIHALDLTPPESWLMFLKVLMEDGQKHVLFCLDRFGKRHQGTTFDDLVAGVYFSYGEMQLPRPFIVEYTAKPDHRVLWYNWENEFWNKALKVELLGTIKAIQRGDTDINQSFRNISVDENGKMTEIK